MTQNLLSRKPNDTTSTLAPPSKQPESDTWKPTVLASRDPAVSLAGRPALMDAGHRISIMDLHAYYGAAEAVKGVTIDFPARQTSAIIGPSGCGKSTLLRCINRMHEEIPGAHATGKVMLNDQDLYGSDVGVAAVRHLIGMVFQKANPFPRMSIFDNGASGLRLTGSKGNTSASASTTRYARSGSGMRSLTPRFAGRGPLRRPAATTLLRPSDRRRARGDPAGRTLLSARPARDTEDRDADR